MSGLSPSIAVVMSTYNGASYVEAQLSSILAQDCPNVHVVVRDDGSADETVSVAETLAAEDPRITVVKNENNMGVAATRNRGFDMSRGQYVALLDSDDVWHAEKLERQLALLRDSGAGFSYCSYAIVDAEDQRIKNDYIVPATVEFQALLRENVIGCSTVMLRADILASHRFRTHFYHEDYVLWLQMLKDGCKAAGCQQVLLTWRYIQSSRSFNKLSSAKNRWRIYRKYLKLPLGESIYYFMCYAAAGLRKYCSKAK